MTVNPSGEQIEIVHGDHRAWIVEVGGALRAYQAGGHALLDGYRADQCCTDARGQSLIPWPNRIGDGLYRFEGAEYQLALSEPAKRNAIHGLIRWTNWAVADREADRVTMRHTLHPQPGYPFALELAIEYSLSAAGLTVRTAARNVGAGRCPFGTGAHPYVTAGTAVIDPLRLESPGSVRVVSDDRGLPVRSEAVAGTEYDFRTARTIGGTILDTAYTDLDRGADRLARVSAVDADSNTGVTVWLDEAYPHLMLFTGDSLPEPARRRRGLGVEPMTCAPDAFRSGEGLRVLEPGEVFEGSWGIAPWSPGG